MEKELLDYFERSFDESKLVRHNEDIKVMPSLEFEVFYDEEIHYSFHFYVCKRDYSSPWNNYYSEFKKYQKLIDSYNVQYSNKNGCYSLFYTDMNCGRFFIGKEGGGLTDEEAVNILNLALSYLQGI